MSDHRQAQADRYIQTAIASEQATANVPTSTLSEVGRSERDKLFISSLLALLLAASSPEKANVSVGGIDIPDVNFDWLAVGILTTIIYFALTFAVTAWSDIIRSRATFTIALRELSSRASTHQEALALRASDAEKALRRFRDQTAQYFTKRAEVQSEVEQLSEELKNASSSEAWQETFAKLDRRQSELQSLRDKQVEAANTLTEYQSAEPSLDLAALEVAAKRTGLLRFLRRVDAALSLLVPLSLGAIAFGALVDVRFIP